jgi:hypothetical protein
MKNYKLVDFIMHKNMISHDLCNEVVQLTKNDKLIRVIVSQIGKLK